MAKTEVKCLGFNDFAQGYFKLGKQVAYANDFLPGEIGLVDKNRFGKYFVSSIIKKSKDRVTPKCEYYNYCGGCQILHMNEMLQKQFKIDYVKTAFKENKLNAKIDNYIDANRKEAYRNKMQVAYSFVNGKVVYGFYEEDSHKIIPMKKCLVQTDKQNEIVKEISIIMKEMNIRPYDEDKRNGFIRFVMIREAFTTGEILVTIVTSTDIFKGQNEFIKRLLNRCNYITTVVQNINSRKTSIILGEQEKVLYGKGYIIDTLCGITFKISSKTFYQINHEQTEKLYNLVKEYAKVTKDDILLDAYCGVGTIGMVLSPLCKKVIGVESNKQSVLNARINAKENHINNISFVCADATEFISSYKEHIDVLVLDPPRSGSTPTFLNAIEKLKPNRVVYVSCEAKTLARDLCYLSKYTIDKVSLVDMFVGTYHVETITLLCLKDAKKLKNTQKL